MLQLETRHGVRLCNGMSRRDFLRAGGLAVGLSLTELACLQSLGAAPRNSEKACIQIELVGGPGQLDTWDLKPDASDDIRGPFRPIQTSVPGINICEHFPRMAQIADRYAIIRSVYHREAPIHETGQQLMQTGRLSSSGMDWPHYGAVLSRLSSGVIRLRGIEQRQLPSAPPHHLTTAPPNNSWVVLPGPIGNTGVSISRGQTAGFLGPHHEPFVLPSDAALLEGHESLPTIVDRAQRLIEQTVPEHDPAFDGVFSSRAKQAFDLTAEPEPVRSRYGWNTFGQSCLLARRLVQNGVKLVTVNMFDTVFGKITWDCHANGSDLNTTLDDYKEMLCPMLDVAYTALLDDLHGLGLLDSTLVLCMGEFGRTPKLNSGGGRDHWPHVWSVLMAGGGIRGGQIIGASDRDGAAPKDRPVHPSEIAATVYHALDIDLATKLQCPDGQTVALVDAKPVGELF